MSLSTMAALKAALYSGGNVDEEAVGAPWRELWWRHLAGTTRRRRSRRRHRAWSTGRRATRRRSCRAGGRVAQWSACNQKANRRRTGGNHLEAKQLGGEHRLTVVGAKVALDRGHVDGRGEEDDEIGCHDDEGRPCHRTHLQPKARAAAVRAHQRRSAHDGLPTPMR